LTIATSFIARNAATASKTTHPDWAVVVIITPSCSPKIRKYVPPGGTGAKAVATLATYPTGAILFTRQVQDFWAQNSRFSLTKLIRNQSWFNAIKE
jgi:hypothetical protein